MFRRLLMYFGIEIGSEVKELTETVEYTKDVLKTVEPTPIKKRPITKQNFDIFKNEKNCPICESKLHNRKERVYDHYAGNHMSYRLACNNQCYVRIIDADEFDDNNLDDPRWKIFGRDYYVFDDEPRRTRQIIHLYEAINYFRENERYLMEILTDNIGRFRELGEGKY